MNLKQHLIRQMAFSHATFGPGERTGMVIDHIRKELIEVEEANGEAEEWVDVVLLALDGMTRRLAYCGGPGRRDPELVADTVCNMIEGKQSRNEGRNGPKAVRRFNCSPLLEMSYEPRRKPRSRMVA